MSGHVLSPRARHLRCALRVARGALREAQAGNIGGAILHFGDACHQRGYALGFWSAQPGELSDGTKARLWRVFDRTGLEIWRLAREQARAIVAAVA